MKQNWLNLITIAPGHRRVINVRSSNSNNELSHFILRHTGSNGSGAVTADRNRKQAIQVWGGYLKISNREITDGAGDGIRLHAEVALHIVRMSPAAL